MIIFQGVDSKDYGVQAKISGWGTLYERYAVEVIFVILFCFGNFMKFKEKNNIKNKQIQYFKGFASKTSLLSVKLKMHPDCVLSQ